MNVLEDVRLAEKEWARKFSGRREVPRLGLGRPRFGVNRVLNGFACATRRLALTAASAVAADARRAKSPTLSVSCEYRG
jgi:hypothetical protein